MNIEAKAHLAVIREATIEARHLCLAGKNIDRAADLLDAIHNTPDYISEPFCSEEKYIEMYYKAYDIKWDKSCRSLVDIYINALNG